MTQVNYGLLVAGVACLAGSETTSGRIARCEYNVIAAPNNIAAITKAITLAVNQMLAASELKNREARAKFQNW